MDLVLIKVFLEDQIHPNEKAQSVIFKNIWEMLEPNAQIKSKYKFVSFKTFPPFLTTWLTFALAAVPVTTGSIWATVRTTSLMTDIAFAEWAILTVSLTVWVASHKLDLSQVICKRLLILEKKKRNSALFSSILALVITCFLGGVFFAVSFYITLSLNLLGKPDSYLYPPNLLFNKQRYHDVSHRFKNFRSSKTLHGYQFYKYFFVVFLEISLFLNFDPLASFLRLCCFLVSLFLFIYFFFSV